MNPTKANEFTKKKEYIEINNPEEQGSDTNVDIHNAG